MTTRTIRKFQTVLSLRSYLATLGDLIEPSTNKVLYFTWEGKIYTEDKSGRLMQLDGLESIFPQNGQNTVQNKGRHAKNSYSENATTFNNPKELQFGKPEAFMEPEPFMQFSKSLYHENIPFMSPRVGPMEMGLVQEDSWTNFDYPGQFRQYSTYQQSDNNLWKSSDKNLFPSFWKMFNP